jgi:hypothetical protein
MMCECFFKEQKRREKKGKQANERKKKQRGNLE